MDRITWNLWTIGALILLAVAVLSLGVYEDAKYAAVGFFAFFLIGAYVTRKPEQGSTF